MGLKENFNIRIGKFYIPTGSLHHHVQSTLLRFCPSLLILLEKFAIVLFQINSLIFAALNQATSVTAGCENRPAAYLC